VVVAQHSAAAGGVAAAHRPPALRPARPQPVHCGGHQPAGAAAARRCTSTTGQHWEETCTLWQDGHRYAVEVDVTDYPYPLRAMAGLWQVDPHTMGSRVTMRFAYRAGDGTESRRVAEPYRLVSTGRRWYLVAYDLDREDFRTFRVDRVSEPFATGARFAPRARRHERRPAPA